MAIGDLSDLQILYSDSSDIPTKEPEPKKISVKWYLLQEKKETDDIDPLDEYPGYPLPSGGSLGHD